MKRIAFFSVAVLLAVQYFPAMSQEEDPNQASGWNHNLVISSYIFSDDFFILPVYQVNKGWLHLEARYNYEDMNTFSAWFGYNFSGGNMFEYLITPMLGGIVGNTNGIAPGLELDFLFYGFEFYSESEYIFDFDGKEDYFYYNWTDFSYSPLDWLWFGVSIQRTKLYDTDLEIQRGLLLGGGYRWFGLSGYLYNLGWDEPYGIITLTVSIPE
jgi:hypothetical protein